MKRSRFVLALGPCVLLAALASTAGAQPRPTGGASGPDVTVGTVVFISDPAGLETERVAAVFQTHLTALRSCYLPAVAAAPTLQGEMQVDVTYGRNGRVTAVTSTGLGAAPAVGQCVARVVHPLAFPHPATREAHEVRFLATVEFHPARP